MEIVPVAKIPDKKDVIDTPTDDLMKLYKVCQEMRVTCLESGGIGLAAVQVGIPWRLFVVKGQDDWEYLVNCEYSGQLLDDQLEQVEKDKETMKDDPSFNPSYGMRRAASIEGCLSLKDDQGKLIHYKVDRLRRVRVQGHRLTTKLTVRLEEVDFLTEENIYNVVYQHEIDHQHGILISDHGEEISIEPIVG